MVSVVETISRTAGNIYSISLREAQSSKTESPLGMFSILLEPIMMLGMMTIIFTMVRLRTAGLGDYVMLFLMTGIVPLSVFKGSVKGGERAYTRMRRLLVFPRLHLLDLVAGGIFLQLVAMMGLYAIITYFFHYFMATSSPEYFWLSLIPSIGNACIAFGFCMLNLVIRLYFKFWTTLFSIVMGPINILSGMFYTAETMPPPARKYLYYNPLFHSTEWTRSFYFPEYTSDLFDPYYYGGWVLGAIVIGLLLEHVFRYRLLQSTV